MTRMRRPRRTLVAALVISAALALVATGGWVAAASSRPTGGAPPSAWFAEGSQTWVVDFATGLTASQVDRLLAQRSSAVGSGSRTTFLSGVYRSARPAQAVVFGRLTSAPLASYRVSRKGTPPVTLETLRAGVLRAAVAAHSRLSSDAAVADTPGGASLRLSSDGWRLVRVGVRRPDLWDLSRVDVARGAHSLVLVAAGAGDPQALASEADQAASAVADICPWRWSGRVVVELPSDAAQLARMVRAPGSRSLAAVTSYRDDGDGRVVRVRLNPRTFPTMVPLARQILLRHELLHAAQTVLPERNIPTWLAEGSADYVGYLGSGVPDQGVAPGLFAEVRDGLLPSRLPADRQFSFTGSQRDRRLAYELGWAASRAVVDRYGQDALFRLYAAVARGSGPEEARQRRAVGDVLGLDSAQFTALWQAWLRSHA